MVKLMFGSKNCFNIKKKNVSRSYIYTPSLSYGFWGVSDCPIICALALIFIHYIAMGL